MNEAPKVDEASEIGARLLPVDMRYVQEILLRLLDIPSPTGYTDTVVHQVCHELSELGISHELTRRGAIRANLKGAQAAPARAIVAHLDTVGAMVKNLKPNGRLELAPIGTWPPRFAEGARVTVFCDDMVEHRGTILPLMASGHTFHNDIDTQPAAWDNLELRVDDMCHGVEDLVRAGFNVGDFVAIDPRPEVTRTGFVNARHLDDKAGVAVMLGAAKAVVDAQVPIAVDCHLLFTISEEVGVGASHVLHGDVAEMVGLDNGTIAPGQNTSEYGVTITMQDLGGPFDVHLTHKLIRLCREFEIEHSRDVFKYYRSDSAAALEAGNDIRTALVCFGLDASHGWERVHLDSLVAVARLVALYAQSRALFSRDAEALGPVGDLPASEEATSA